MKTEHWTDAQILTAVTDGILSDRRLSHVGKLKLALSLLPEPPTAATLRPIAEAGIVPEGCERRYAHVSGGKLYGALTERKAGEDNHFIDIQLPAKEDAERKAFERFYSSSPTEALTSIEFAWKHWQAALAQKGTHE